MVISPILLLFLLTQQVEEDVGMFTRGLYKMEKTFAENPTVQAMASSVKKDISNFKDYLPLIGAVCNSGLRER